MLVRFTKQEAIPVDYVGRNSPECHFEGDRKQFAKALRTEIAKIEDATITTAPEQQPSSEPSLPAP